MGRATLLLLLPAFAAGCFQPVGTASSDAGTCPEGTYPTMAWCDQGRIETLCCPDGAHCAPPESFCDLGAGSCVLAIAGCPLDAGAAGASDAHVAAAPDAGMCFGYCPKPNGSSCQDDCNCYEKCIHGICSAAKSQTVLCVNGAGCPDAGTCTWGICEGAACTTSDDCSPMQSCEVGVCTLHLCI